MATIKDVARLAGVSVATVSRVINNSPKASEASRLAVHSAMESLSYHPNANARALAQQTTETVGLIVGDVSDPFFGAMVKAVEQVAYHTGNFLLIGNGYHNEQKERQAIEQLIRHRCAALVVHAKMIPDADLASLMKQMPGMVLINRILPGFENRCIALDDRYGAWLATRHLIQQGNVDAWAIWDPYYSAALLQGGVRVLKDGTDLNQTGSFYLAARPYAEKNGAFQ